jgi:DNA-binding winged helix-turn-helix (wHTH) protein
MSDSLKPQFGRHKYLLGLVSLLFISVICAAFGMNSSDDFDTARREVLLRGIGHELLLQSGDSTSRVLPVKKIAANEYQISFEQELYFRSDSLVNTTRRLLAQDPQAMDYIVKVLNCANSSVAYGFAIADNKKDDIVACLRREQPRACYMINIQFKPAGSTIDRNRLLIGTLPLLAFVGFVFLRSVKPRRAAVENNQTEGIYQIGAVVFDVNNRKLIINEKPVDLTGTETRLFRIFANSPDEIIERSRLQKEIWEDEGVIVGRSLDMFISKLRKKLETEPGINIVVVRGKGYRLEVAIGNLSS